MTNTIRTGSRARPSQRGDRVPITDLTSGADALDTFLWQADPRSLRLTFASGQVGRILGADASRWAAERQPWRAIAGADRHRVELALRRAVREEADTEIEFTAAGASGKFPARLVIRVARPEGGPLRLWGLLSDLSHDHRLAPLPIARVSVPLSAPPMIRRATRLVAVCVAGLFASYALAVSAARPVPASPPAAVATQRAEHLEEVLHAHAAEEHVLEDAVGSIEASVSELVTLPKSSLDLTALDVLREKISDLIPLSPPELAGRLRALLARIDRVGAGASIPPVPVSKPTSQPANEIPPATETQQPPAEPAPPEPAPTSAPSEAPPAPSGAPSAPGVDDL